jgi:hypothetical protein
MYICNQQNRKFVGQVILANIRNEVKELSSFVSHLFAWISHPGTKLLTLYENFYPGAQRVGNRPLVGFKVQPTAG